MKLFGKNIGVSGKPSSASEGLTVFNIYKCVTSQKCLQSSRVLFARNKLSVHGGLAEELTMLSIALTILLSQSHEQ
jgi:hypothetical protein